MSDSEMLALAPRHRLFVAEFLKDLNAYGAAQRAGFNGNTGVELIARPDVRVAVSAGLREKVDSAGRDAQAVLDYLWEIVNADPSGITTLHHYCCRYCHGEDFKEQHTPKEIRDRQRWYGDDDLEVLAGMRDAGMHAFPEDGGVWNPDAEPNPECPECRGKGIPRVELKNIDTLPRELKRLFSSVKRKADGSLEVTMRSQDRALELLAKYYGLLDDRVDLRVGVDLAARIVAARSRS
jgi:hypothetical protein